MDKILKVGIIGCGRISVMHLGAVSILSMAKLVCCCDIVKEKADKVAEQYNVKAYYDYKEMLDNEELDAVHICLPHYLHVPVASYAFMKGINVLSEKPMSIDYDSAKNAVNLAKQCNVLYGVIFQCRYNNSVKLVKKALDLGKLGKIITVCSSLTWSRPDSYYLESDWKGTWDKEGGGVIIDQAIHSIDLVNWLVNSDIESVSVSMANRGHKIIKVEDCADGMIVYKNKVKYSFYCMNNYGMDEPIEIKMFCENGKVVFGYDDAEIIYNDGTREEAHQDENTVAFEGVKDYWGFQHIRQIRQFYNSCLGKEKLEISGEEALKTHKLIMDIYSVGKKNYE